MLTTKNQKHWQVLSQACGMKRLKFLGRWAGISAGLFNAFNRSTLCLATASLIVASGCTPPGPRAVLQGKKLIEQGKYPQAIVKLRTATSLLATNAPAWNYLGLACHYGGQVEEAERCYRRALVLNRDLTEAHYNL